MKTANPSLVSVVAALLGGANVLVSRVVVSLAVLCASANAQVAGTLSHETK
jgi:hypothetical protein